MSSNIEGPFMPIPGIIHPFMPRVSVAYKPDKNFPGCCEFHRSYLKSADSFLDKFPDCCETHRAMARLDVFNINLYKYDGAAINLIKRIDFTIQHVLTHLDQSDWHEDITDYIDYVIESLGTPSVGEHIYFEGLSALLRYWSSKGRIAPNKAQKLLDHVATCKQDKAGTNMIDVNELLSIYRKWFTFFPFNLYPLNEFKKEFDHPFTMLAFNSKRNRYTGVERARLMNKTQSIAWLIDTTRKVLALSRVKSKQLLDNRLIEDADQHQTQLIEEGHTAKQSALLKDFSENESEYVETVNRWLANEEEYFAKMIPRIRHLTQTTNKLPDVVDDRVNLFNHPMTIAEVEDHFRPLVARESRNGKPYLTESQFSHFIQRAFEEKNGLEKLTINFSRGETESVKGLFYAFFVKCTEEYRIEPTRHCKDKYVRLLTDNFTNFNYSTVFSDFNTEKRLK